MELANHEVEAVRAVAEKVSQDDSHALSELSLALAGGGTGDVSFG